MTKSVIKIFLFIGIIYLALFIKKSLNKSTNFISIVNVGQGDGIYIHTEQANILIDGGANYDIENYLNSKNNFPFCEIDMLFLTHPHLDHLLGLDRVLKRCRVGSVVFSHVQYNSKLYNDFVLKITQGIKEKKYRFVQPQSPNTFKFGFLTIIVLYPNKDSIFDKKDVNDVSTALLIDYKDFEALLTGDLPAERFDEFDLSLINKYVQNRIDLFKVSHHGSNDALNKDFLMELRPKYCAISVGVANKYNHPHKEVLEFLNQINCKVLRTDFDNNIEIKMP